jgi:hypothetical protein
MPKWRPYRFSLKSPLTSESDLTVEVPARLEALCKFYGIALDDPLWERKLLLTLAQRHVPGLGYRHPRKETRDAAFLIECINGLRDKHEVESGIRPSAEAVITEILEAPGSEFKGLTVARAKRIYYDAGQATAVSASVNASVQRLSTHLKHSKKLGQAPADSHASLFNELNRQRNP